MTSIVRLTLASLLLGIGTASVAMPGASIGGSSVANETSRNKLINEVVVNGRPVSEIKVRNPLGFVVFIELKVRSLSGNEVVITDSTCTGVAISRDLIATAGHCLDSAVSAKVRFFPDAGRMDMFEEIEAKAWEVHPDVNAGYSGKQLSNYTHSEAHKYHDIAVILLKNPAQFAFPIATVPENFDIRKYNNTQLYAFGRGRDQSFREKNTIEFTKIKDSRYIGDKNIMVGDIEENDGITTGLCWGDSGGPLTIVAPDREKINRHYLLGIFTMHTNAIDPIISRDQSGKRPSAKCGSKAYFTAVSYELKWLRETITKLDQENPR